MRHLLLAFLLWAGALVGLPASGWAQDRSVDATDREIIEWLTRVETRLTRVETHLEGLAESLKQLRTDMQLQNQQLRADFAGHIEQLHHRLDSLLFIFIGVIGFIGVIIAALIGVVIRDRRTTPSSSQPAGESQEDVRQRQAAIHGALRALAQRNEDVRPWSNSSTCSLIRC